MCVCVCVCVCVFVHHAAALLTSVKKLSIAPRYLDPRGSAVCKPRVPSIHLMCCEFGSERQKQKAERVREFQCIMFLLSGCRLEDSQSVSQSVWSCSSNPLFVSWVPPPGASFKNFQLSSSRSCDSSRSSVSPALLCAPRRGSVRHVGAVCASVVARLVNRETCS